MKIYIGSDHAGVDLKELVKQHFANQFEFVDAGTFTNESVDYPDFAKNFDKSKVLKAIKKNGSYKLSYRIKFNGNICNGNLKAATVSEPDGEKLVFGLYVSEPIE